MKNIGLAVAALALSAGVAMAAPGKNHRWHGGGGMSPYERVQIANARAQLAQVRARAWRDGRVTFVERFQIRQAEQRLQRVILRARYS